MNTTCPHCGQALRRWRCIPYALGDDRFRCNACGTWLRYEFSKRQPGWLTRQLSRPAALILAPPIIAIALTTALIAFGFGVVWLGNRAIALALIFIGAVLLKAGVDTMSQVASARLVVAGSQSKRLSLAAIQHAWKVETAPKAMKARARILAFHIQTWLYCWLIFEALAWVSNYIAHGNRC